MSTDDHEFVVHLSPVRRDRADFIVHAGIEDGGHRRFEQLWARQIDDTRFELCCIPFFVYDVALGDEIETEPAAERQYVFARVARPSGGYTFRAWFGDSEHPRAREELVEALQAGGWLFEWYSENLLAIDAADPERAQELADVLVERQRRGHLIYETGRTA